MATRFQIEYRRMLDEHGASMSNTDGYAAWAYLSGSPPSDGFATRAEAQAWLKSEHLGPDAYGVNAEFSIVEQFVSDEDDQHIADAYDAS